MKISRFNEFKDMSDELKYHIENNIPFTKNIFREGSDAFYKLLKEVRELYENNQIELNTIGFSLAFVNLNKFSKIPVSFILSSYCLAKYVRLINIQRISYYKIKIKKYSEFIIQESTSLDAEKAKEASKNIGIDLTMSQKNDKIDLTKYGKDIE